MSIRRFDFETSDCVAAMNEAGVFVERWPDYIKVFTDEDIPQQPVPDRVTPRQIRLALNAAGLRTTVENAVKAGNQDLKDWWEYALDIERNNALIVSMSEQLGMTSEQIDDLFKLAATL